jgi:hypothetical protein
MALTSKSKKCDTEGNGESGKWFYIDKANENVTPPEVENQAKWKKK